MREWVHQTEHVLQLSTSQYRSSQSRYRAPVLKVQFLEDVRA